MVTTTGPRVLRHSCLSVLSCAHNATRSCRPAARKLLRKWIRAPSTHRLADSMRKFGGGSRAMLSPKAAFRPELGRQLWATLLESFCLSHTAPTLCRLRCNSDGSRPMSAEESGKRGSGANSADRCASRPQHGAKSADRHTQHALGNFLSHGMPVLRTHVELLGELAIVGWLSGLVESQLWTNPSLFSDNFRGDSRSLGCVEVQY